MIRLDNRTRNTNTLNDILNHDDSGLLDNLETYYFKTVVNSSTMVRSFVDKTEQGALSQAVAQFKTNESLYKQSPVRVFWLQISEVYHLYNSPMITYEARELETGEMLAEAVTIDELYADISKLGDRYIIKNRETFTKQFTS